jgi:hypothetical protein
VISSSWLSPRRGVRFFPSLQAFAKTRVFEFRNDPTEESMLLSFLPDLYVRWVFSDLISELRDTNMTTWRKLTEAENIDFQLDPRTLEHLRAWATSTEDACTGLGIAAATGATICRAS